MRLKKILQPWGGQELMALNSIIVSKGCSSLFARVGLYRERAGRCVVAVFVLQAWRLVTRAGNKEVGWMMASVSSHQSSIRQSQVRADKLAAVNHNTHSYKSLLFAATSPSSTSLASILQPQLSLSQLINQYQTAPLQPLECLIWILDTLSLVSLYF